MQSYDVIRRISRKITEKSADVSRKLWGYGLPVLIQRLELSNTFHLVGQPTFYDSWFSVYHACSGGHNFGFF